jgi:hypothetical protein
VNHLIDFPFCPSVSPVVDDVQMLEPPKDTKDTKGASLSEEENP